MADKKKLGALGALGKRLLAERPDEVALTAAQRAEAGRKAAELIKSQPQVKASEALGQLMEKGFKRTTTTQADRTRVGGGNIGGAPFSAISEADPAYAGKVWGVMDEGTASRLKNLTTPDTAWTTMLGSADQLKTNPVVFDKLKRQFIDAMKQGKLSPELEAKINHNLALNFGEGAQIRDPQIWKQADTFEKRAALADLMMGQGITPKKGGVPLGGEKSGKGVIFRPTDTLIKETEPTLLHPEHGGDVSTFAAGPRLFTLENESVYRPDLHPGFPTLLTGKDLKVNMIPTPTEVYLPDWHKDFKKKKPERFQGPWAKDIIERRKNKAYQLKGAEGPGYYDLALGLKGEGLPSQDLNDEYIRHLLREGFKDGGTVSMEEADAQLAKAIENRMAKGGEVDMAEADARLTEAIAQRMAGGGKVKGAAKAFKKLFADDVVNGMRIRQDIPNQSSIGASLTDYSTHGLQEVPMSAFETVGKPRYRSVQEEKRTKELARQIQENKELNPLIVVKDAEGHYILEGGHRFDALRELGIDSFPALMVHDLESLGTIAKASGGLAMAKGGNLAALGKLGKRLLADPDAVTPSVSGGTRKFGNDASGLNIIKETGGNWSPSGDLVYQSKLDRELAKLERGRFDMPMNYIQTQIDAAKAKGQSTAALERTMQEAIRKQAANKWVQSNLKNYVTKQMATKDDPVRELAEEGIKAFPVRIDEYGDPELRTYGSHRAKVNREATGNDPKGVAKSPLAKHYETMTDEAITPTPAKHYQSVQALPPMQRGAGVMDAPWVNKLDPETPIFSISRDADFDFYKFGFDHIIDVLHEDLAAGRIRPEQLNKISIEQAVRRTHEYDEALKAKMLNARIAEQANANVHKEYPEGYKWVQLDKPGQFALESDIMGHSVRGYEPPQGHADWADISGDSGYSGYGHGGYEAIKSGDAKIYSLRDPRGLSHVTVEVGKAPLRTWDDVTKAVGKEKAAALHKEFYDIGADKTDNTEAAMAMFLKNKGVQPTEFISQVKGKQNAAPNEEYLPFVQDFVKSGNWSEVGDIKNTGLIRRDNKYLTPSEDADWLLKELGLKPDDGMAEGGGAFKKLSFYGSGGITTSGGTFSPEELGVSPSELPPDIKFADVAKYAKRIGKNAADLAVEGKEQLEKEYKRLGNKGGKKDALIRVGSQIAGSGPDTVNFGLSLLDDLQSLVPALNKPASVMDTAGTGDTVPKFKLAFDETPFGGEHLIRKFKEAQLLGENEFPLTEIVANLFAPAAATSALRKSKQAYKTAKDSMNTPKKRQGGLTAMAR